MSYIPPHLRGNKPKPTPAISEQTTATMPYIPPPLRVSDQGKPASPLSPPSSSTQHPHLSFRSSSDVIYSLIVLLHHQHLSCQHVKFTTFDRLAFAHLQHLQLYTLTPDLDPGQLNSTEVIEQIPRNPANVIVTAWKEDPRNPANVIVTAWKEDLKEVLEKFGRFTCAESRNRMVPTILLRFGRIIFHDSRGRFEWRSSYTPEILESYVKTRRLSKTFDPWLSMEEFVFLRKLAHKDALHIQWEEQILFQVEDVMTPGSKLWCKCSRSEDNEQSVNPGMKDDLLEITGSAKDSLELKKVTFLPVRHMIGDVACVGKSADIRLAFLTEEYPELTEMELCDLKSIFNKASIDGTGVHWPPDSSRKISSSGRFKVVGKSHLISSVVIGGGLKWHLCAYTSLYQVYVEPIMCNEFCEGQKEWNIEKAILSIEELLQRVWADCII